MTKHRTITVRGDRFAARCRHRRYQAALDRPHYRRPGVVEVSLSRYDQYPD